MKALFLFLIISLSLPFLNGCGSRSETTENMTAQEDSSKTSGEQHKDFKIEKSVPVETTPLTRGNIANYLLYSSTLETEELADVYPRIGGLVEAIYVEESQKVVKGQKLLQIERDLYELDEQNASLEYQKQKTNFQRITALQEEQLLSEEEYENARLLMEQAKIAWDRAKLNLEYTTVRAPISGVVGERLVRKGDRVQTSDKVFSMANLDEKIVRAYVPQSEFGKVFQNQKAVVYADIIPGQNLNAFVKRISPIIDPQSGTFKVTVAVKDPANKLRPGMFVNAQLIVDTHQNTPLIPKSALVYENERVYFYTVTPVPADSSGKPAEKNGGIAQRQELKKGFEDAEKVEVLNEISIGTPVVVLGQNGLKDGSKVKVTNEKQYVWQRPGGSGISMRF
ncbi:MAG TPA: efflux RND transporter periplasmic adaptor subunit [Calditrichia bacterium]|nr:efflux RND transporter periplasmic adaptor subunit [Calditrichota bacterium]HQU73744.1 efflux RND transporter periplasmic adaptor subunit [Calditrichia bacterium]HQV30612.1 efflux RND transporter periplasmic adaptor subunit [Calditrichia bacterium]